MWLTLEECAKMLGTSPEQAAEQMGDKIERRTNVELDCLVYNADEVAALARQLQAACSVRWCTAPARRRGMCERHHKEKTA